MLYFISFGLIIVGIAVYSVKSPPVSPQQGDYREMLVDGSPAPEGHEAPVNHEQQSQPNSTTPANHTGCTVTSPRYEAAKYTVNSPDNNTMVNNKHYDDINNIDCTEMLASNQYEHTIDLRPYQPVTITDIRQESNS